MAKRSSSRRRKGQRRARQRKPRLGIRLTGDQWLDILGVALVAVAAATVLSFLSARQGIILGWWIGLLSRVFGWGVYVAPLFIGALGLWLILRRFGERLPRVEPERAVGAGLGYFAALTTLHLLAALLGDGALWEVAEAGRGGGYVGAAIAQLLLGGLGDLGTGVVLVVWWLMVLMLGFGLSPAELAEAVARLARRLRPTRVRRPRAQLPLPETQRAPRPAPATLDEPVTRTPERAPAPVGPVPVARTEPGPLYTQPRLIGGDQAWQLPPLDQILDPGDDQDFAQDLIRQQARIIEDTLTSLGAPVKVKEINQGPVVTQFGLEPLFVSRRDGKEMKVKVSKISALADDLALALSARSIRVEAPVPGKGLVGIEVPNTEVALVALQDVIESEAFQRVDSSLRLGLGQDVSGQGVVADLAVMPHLLIAGTTGSGKSVCINAIITALLLQNTPDDLKLLMVDPKRVELTIYNGIPHLLAPVVVDLERVVGALQWVMREMDGRYRRFADVGARNIEDFNQRIAPREGEKKLPYIVVIIDELADLMMMAPDETERSICRLAQMARATGIHLIIATQRPSVDVVTGLIKANFPARISFAVVSSVDSRVVLDMPGAERLLGRGDMLFMAPDASQPVRLQGAFVSDDELQRLVRYWKGARELGARPIGRPIQQPLWEEMREREKAAVYEDELLPDAVEVVLSTERASISLLQRRLRIGYNRAARLIDLLEEKGVVGPAQSGGQAREVFPAAAQALLQAGGETG